MKVGLALAAGLVFVAATRAAADSLPMDTPTSIDGIQTVCTGVGSSSTAFTTSGSGPQQRVEIQFTHLAANQ